MSAPKIVITQDGLDVIDRFLARSAPTGADAAAWLNGTAETQPARLRRPNRHERRSQFVRYRPQRSPDRQKSYERRHRLAFSGPMPPHLAARFTVGEMACLRVVSDEHRAKGFCDLDLNQIAARAGVARKTAQRALRHAGPGSNQKWAKKGEGLLTIEERRPKGRRKHFPNLVRITSPEWLTWLKRRPDGAQMKTGQSSPTTVKTIDNDVVLLRETTSNDEGPQSGHPSKEAIAFATELASISGHRLNRLPQSWLDTNPAQVVQTWINSLIDVGATLKGDPIAMLRLIAQDVMRRKPDPEPPRSPRYFSPTVRQVVDNHIRARTMPLPLAKVAA
jgi:hypothetical protein